MKKIYYFIVLLYMLYRVVYGAKFETNTVTVENVDYEKNKFWKAGDYQSINCKVSNKNQKVEWIDPLRHRIEQEPNNRVYAQQRYVPLAKGSRIPALVLNFKELLVNDSGMYECLSGNSSSYAFVCVIDPLEFVDISNEVTVTTGRSITLSCPAKGDPEPRIIWRRSDENIDDESSNSKYKVMNKFNSKNIEGLLTITSLQPEDSGAYSCVAVQEIPHIDNCKHSAIYNITLQINHPPIFDHANDTKLVYGKINESVDLVCSAKGFPTPTYRWFKDDGDTFFEYNEKQINNNEDTNEAVLTLIASPSTFGKRFKCQATNDHGDSNKYFTILKMEKPKRASEVNYYNSTENQIQLNISWYDEVLFPIDGFDIQYLKEDETKRNEHAPKELEWKKSKQIEVKLDEDAYADPNFGILITLNNLDTETVYWVRLRVVNHAGQSPWSKPVQASTTSAAEEVTEIPTNEATIIKAGVSSETTFYGIFFAGGILIVAVAFMFAMRAV